MTVGESVLQMSRRAIQRRTAPHVRVRQVVVRMCPYQNGHLITAAYHLHQPTGPLTTPLLFDLMSSRLSVLGMRSEVLNASAEELSLARARPTVLVLTPNSWHWENTIVELDLFWDRDRNPALAYILIPDSFPMPVVQLTSSEQWDRPLIAFRDVDLSAYRIGGVASRANQADNEWISAVVAEAETVVEEAPPGARQVLLSRVLAAHASSGERARMASYVNNVIHFFSGQFALDPSVVPCVKWPAEFACYEMMPNNACIIATPQDFGLRENHGEPNDLYLAEQLAGIWWGGGSRLIGPEALEMECAVTIAFALRWIQFAGTESQVQEAVRLSMQRTRIGRLNGVVARLRGRLNERVAFKWAVQLFEGIEADHSVLERIQTLLNDNWGRYIHSSVASRCLRLA